MPDWCQALTSNTEPPFTTPYYIRWQWMIIKTAVYLSDCVRTHKRNSIAHPWVFLRQMTMSRIFPTVYLLLTEPSINSEYTALIQLSAVITQSNIVQYYINNYRNWGRISVRSWIHKRHPNLALMGELQCVFVNICEKIEHVITASHCS